MEVEGEEGTRMKRKGNGRKIGRKMREKKKIEDAKEKGRKYRRQERKAGGWMEREDKREEEVEKGIGNGRKRK